jgi:hypothetical protein
LEGGLIGICERVAIATVSAGYHEADGRRGSARGPRLRLVSVPIPIRIPEPLEALPAGALPWQRRIARLAVAAQASVPDRRRAPRAPADASRIANAPCSSTVELATSTALAATAGTHALIALRATGAADGNQVVAKAGGGVAAIPAGSENKGIIDARS